MPVVKTLTQDEKNPDLSICSLNIRGMNDDYKRMSLYNCAVKQKFDLMFLQETYSSQESDADRKRHV